MSARLGSLCSGAGQFDVAVAEVLGDVEHAWFAENDPAAAKVLAHHWPDVPNLGDITAVDWAGVPNIDVLTAGFPCQPWSMAGKQGGLMDKRHLWPQVLRCIAALRPKRVVLENVSGLVSTRAYVEEPNDRCICGWHFGRRGLRADLRTPRRHVRRTRQRGNDHTRIAVAPLAETRVRRQGDDQAAGVRSMGRRVRLATSRHRIGGLPCPSPPAPADQGRTSKARAATGGDPLLAPPATERPEPLDPCGAQARPHPSSAHAGTESSRSVGRRAGHGWQAPVCAACGRRVGHRPTRSVLRSGLSDVLGGLAGIGYVCAWTCVRASDVGAAHQRLRIFIVAVPADAPRDGHVHAGTSGGQRVPATAVGGAVRPGGVASLLPTPVAHDTGRSPERHVAMRVRTGHASVTSLAVAAQLLPTPAARDAGRGGGYGDQPGRPLSETILRLLPTPAARLDESRGTPDTQTAARRMYDEGRRNLEDTIALLSTPRATDGTNGGPNQRGSSGDLMLPSAVMLLPTPTVADSRGSRNATAGRTNPKPDTNDAGWTLGWTLSDIAYAARWGEYAPAIARWEHVTGRTAPDPTEPGSKGQPRLSARFAEWLMGWPDGWGTAVPGVTRNDALRIIGNGVVPQQAAYAVSLLLDAHWAVAA